MAGVFKNIDPPPPSPPGECVPSPLLRGEDTLAGWRRGWGVNNLECVPWTMLPLADTALHSTYVSTLW
jgi:hypothetical protein